MAHVVVMPKLGNTVESCIIVKWNVSEGQAIKADTVLCEIETDKATMDVPAGVEGTLMRRLRNEGDDVPVLEAIAIIGTAGESIGGFVGTAGAASSAAATAVEASQAPISSAPAAAGPAPAAQASHESSASDAVNGGSASASPPRKSPCPRGKGFPSPRFRVGRARAAAS